MSEKSQWEKALHLLSVASNERERCRIAYENAQRELRLIYAEALEKNPAQVTTLEYAKNVERIQKALKGE